MTVQWITLAILALIWDEQKPSFGKKLLALTAGIGACLGAFG